MGAGGLARSPVIAIPRAYLVGVPPGRMPRKPGFRTGARRPAPRAGPSRPSLPQGVPWRPKAAVRGPRAMYPDNKCAVSRKIRGGRVARGP